MSILLLGCGQGKGRRHGSLHLGLQFCSGGSVMAREVRFKFSLGQFSGSKLVPHISVCGEEGTFTLRPLGVSIPE